jgi:hypothetical protein
MKVKLILLIALLLIAATTVAKTTEDIKGTVSYEITKHTISSGGGQISGGVYTLVTSIGQIDAGHNANGGSYQFTGGILTTSISTNEVIFEDGFE